MTTTVDTPLRPIEREGNGFDRLLGPASRRYLGFGHARVSLYVTGLNQLAEDTFGAVATVIYPLDWSLKEGQARTPHLSTVDAIRIAEIAHDQLLETHLSWLSGYSESSLEIRAGAKPCETLDEVAVTSRVQGNSQEDAVVMSHKIGTLAITVTWSRRATSARSERKPLGRDDSIVDSVQLQGADTATCRVRRVTNGRSELPFVEALTLTAQLAQVVLYGGSASGREKSQNLWMRRARFERLVAPDAVPQVVSVHLHNQRQLSIGGDAIHTAEVLAEDVCGIRVTASLATHA